MYDCRQTSKYRHYLGSAQVGMMHAIRALVNIPVHLLCMTIQLIIANIYTKLPFYVWFYMDLMAEVRIVSITKSDLICVRK